MDSHDDALSICGFLKQTPEGSLRKMMIDKDLTDMHFRMLLKLAKGGPEAEFADAYVNESMGKMRLSSKEAVLKENFWPICKKKFLAIGLVTPQAAAA